MEGVPRQEEVEVGEERLQSQEEVVEVVEEDTLPLGVVVVVEEAQEQVLVGEGEGKLVMVHLIQSLIGNYQKFHSPADSSSRLSFLDTSLFPFHAQPLSFLFPL